MKVAGMLLALLGAAVMAGWWLHLPFLVRLIPNYSPMVFNSALCFALAGASLMASASSKLERLRIVGASGVLAIASLVLVEHAFGVDLGIDWPSLHAWLGDASPTPGRTSPATATAFALAGLALIGAAHGGRRWIAAAVRALTIAVALCGALALAGYFVDAQLLFPRYPFTGVAAHTACGLLVLAAGLWRLPRRSEWGRAALFERDDARITFAAAAVLVVTALCAGLATFSILQGRVQDLVRAELLIALQRRADMFQDLIDLRDTTAQIAATRPAVLRNLRVIAAGKDDGSNLENVRAVAEGFVKTGFSAIAYHDAGGRPVAASGRFAERPALAVPLGPRTDRAELLWQDGFLLRHRLPLRDGSGLVGELVAEQPLPALTRLTQRAPGRGESWDMGICAARGESLRCFPQLQTPQVFSVPPTTRTGDPLPMTRALGGETGTTLSRDYRSQIIVAAYGPIHDLGLGMVVKVDAAEVFRPLREEFQIGLAVLLLLVLGGTALLRSQVKPLVGRLVDLTRHLEERVGQRTAELNRALDNLRLSEQHYRSLFDANPHPMWVYDVETLKFLAVNEAAIRKYGYSREELLAMSALDLRVPGEREELRARLARLGPLHRYDSVVYHRKKSGEEIEVQIVSEPMMLGARGRLVLAQDITERARLMSALREREAALQRAQAMAKLAHVITGAQGEFLRWSDTLPPLVGRAPSDMPRTTREWLELIHPDDRALFRSTSIQAGAQRSHAEVEYRLRAADGRWLTVRQVMEPIGPDAPGRELEWFNTLQDVTDVRRTEQHLRESEARFREMAEHINSVFYLRDADGQRMLYISPAYERIWGRTRESLYVDPASWGAAIHPDDRAAVQEKNRAGLLAGSYAFEYRIVRPDGSIRWVETKGNPVADETGRIVRIAGVADDITERKRAEVRIRRLNRVYAVLSHINNLIVRAQGRDELFKEACRIAIEHGGFRMAWIGLVDEAAGVVKPVASAGDVRDFFERAPLAAWENRPGSHGLAGRAAREQQPIVCQDVRTDARPLMRKELDERQINSLALIPLIRGERAFGVLALYAADRGFFDDEEMKLLLELAGDIAFAVDHLEKAARIEYLAYYDPLTGLANRALLLERTTQEIGSASREGHALAVLKLDLDRFRTINDTLGRAAGDALLVQVAARLARAVPDAHRLARSRADLFAILLPHVKNEEQAARFIAELLKNCFGEPFRVAGKELGVSAKVGATFYPADGADADALLANAEAALKRAKDTGDPYLFYEAKMSARVAEKLSLENELRQALARDEFVLFYQPKVDLETRHVAGVEALIRWRHRTRGLVPPAHFIPLLEETGLIREVGAWALQRAARDHRAWTEARLRAPRVAVNVSALQLRQRDFVRAVEDAIMEGVAPTAIDLEITESLVMEDIRANIQKLQALRRLGIAIAIDDFGTGYSSLAYLAQLPAQALKIDRSFIMKMNEDASALTLVSTIISLAHSLRLKVIAEGVETEDQARVLRGLRCDQMQGFLISRPVPADQLVALLEPA